MKEMYDLILITLNYYPSTEATAKLMKDLTFILSNDISILVIAPDKAYLNSQIKYKNFESINKNLDILRIKVPKFDKNKAFSKMILYHYFSRKSIKYIKNIKTNTIMSLMPPFFLAYNLSEYSKKNNKNFIFLIHDLHPDTLLRWNKIKKNNPIYKILENQTKKTLDNSKKIISIGRDNKNYLIQNYEINDNKIEIIQNWAEDMKENFIVDNNLKNKYFPKGFNIIYTGNLGEAQITIEKFFYIIDKLKDENINFLIFGEGRRKNYFLKLCEEKKIKNIYFYDYIYDENAYKNILYFSDACFLSLREESKGMSVPSKTYYYLSAGKPLIVDVPINSEIDYSIKEDEYGININNCDENLVINDIIKIKKDKKLYEKYSINSRKSYETKYNLKNNASKYYNLINKLGE